MYPEQSARTLLFFCLDNGGCPIRSLPNGWHSLRCRPSGTTLHQLPAMRYEKPFVQWVRAYCILDYKAWPLLEDRWDWGEPRNGRGCSEGLEKSFEREPKGHSRSIREAGDLRLTSKNKQMHPMSTSRVTCPETASEPQKNTSAPAPHSRSLITIPAKSATRAEPTAPKLPQGLRCLREITARERGHPSTR